MEPPRSSGFVRRVIWTIVSLFLILILVIAIAWYILKPCEPRFRVSSLSVSNFSATDSQLRGKCEIDLSITNTNRKIQVMVDRFRLSVCYRTEELSSPAVTVQQPIYVDKMSYKDMKVELRLMETPPHNKVVFEDLAKDWSKGVVSFNVKMKARVTYKDGIWPIREKFLEVSCGDLHVVFASRNETGKLLVIGKDCGVDVKLEEEDDEDEESKP